MTRASQNRASKRAQRKTPNPVAPGGNGAAQPTDATSLKAADKNRIGVAEKEILDLLAQKGNIDVEIEAATERSRRLTADIVQKRKDFRDVMRSVVIAHGLDPDRKGGQWNIDVQRDVIEFVRAKAPERKALPPPAPPAPPAGETGEAKA